MAAVAFTPSSQMLKEQETAALKAESEAEAAAKQVESRLEGLCWREFDLARRAKEETQQEMLELLRARKSEYSAAELAFIREEGGGSEVYVPLPQEKCATAVAWLSDLYLMDRPFDIECTPIPDIPPQVKAQIEQECIQTFQMMQQSQVFDTPEALREYTDSIKDKCLTEVRQWAQRRAARNTEKVQDVLIEGGFYEALADAFDDLVSLKAGFIKGPVIKMVKVLTWAADGKSASVERKPKRTFEAPSPFDVYPAPGSGDVQHSHISIRLRLQPTELESFIGVKGFKDDRIREAITKYGTDGVQNWFYEDSERADLEGRTTDQLFTQRGLYDVIEHYTFATGKMLTEFGLKDAGLTDGEVYSITTWMLGRDILIGARINDDPLGLRPLIKMGFRRVRGSFWQQGVIEIIAMLVKMGNAATRSLANNMAMAAGFVTELQVDRLASNEPVRVPRPYSLLQTIAPENGTSGPAMYVHQGQINAQAYMAVYGWVSQLCDAVLGLPSFLSGTSSGGGAGDTSSGLAQLREMATRTFKFTVNQIDASLAQLIDRVHSDLILTEGANDPDLNSDMTVKVKGTKAFTDRQSQQVRLNEMVMSTNNALDYEIMGPEGRAELLRTALKGFDNMDLDRMVPAREQIIYKTKAKEAAAAAMGVDLQGNPLPGAQQQPAARATNPDGSVMGGADQGRMQ